MKTLSQVKEVMQMTTCKFLSVCIAAGISACSSADVSVAQTAAITKLSTPLSGTGQSNCYSNTKQIACPAKGEAFYGQDAQANAPVPTFRNNGDGTVTDVVTGLMWVTARTPSLTWDEAKARSLTLSTGGYNDWRLPNIKELYSLINFRGYFAPTAASSIPFINTEVFDFAFAADNPNGREGSRFIDVQEWSSTRYVATTMNNDATIFGLNFADGRIKGYPLYQPGSNASIKRTMYARYVRGSQSYGVNDLLDNKDGTVIDRATGLTWQTIDDGTKRNWEQALSYCSSLALTNNARWRLPNAKELQSIVDYSKSPSLTNSAAISTPLKVSNQESYFWSSTTLLDGPPDIAPSRAAYVAFGRALGFVQMPPGSGMLQITDVHGAGSQRADPKSGDASQFPQGFGPQGDDVRILNYVRCVTNT